MPYSIQLHNGQVINDIPDDFDPEQVIRAVVQRSAQTAMANAPKESYDATEGMGFLEKLAIGNTAAWNRNIKGAGNLLGLPGKYFSDESLKERDALDKDLDNTAGGTVGRFVGNAAITAPLSYGAAGLVGKALPHLSNAAQAARFAGNTGRANLLGGAQVLTKALGAAGEGAATAALTADPDARGSDAVMGAALGGGLSLAMQGAGRIGRGLVNKSDEYKRILDDTDIVNNMRPDGVRKFEPFVPIGAGASTTDPISSMAKGAYQRAVPYALGAQSMMGRQSDTFAKDVVEMGMQNHAPSIGGQVMSVDRARPLAETVRKLKSGFDSVYENLAGKGDFGIDPDNVVANVKARLAQDPVGRELIKTADGKQFLTELGDVIRAQMDDKGKISLYNLKNVKDDAFNELSGKRFGVGIKAARDEIDSLFGKQWNHAFKSNTPALEALTDYRVNSPAYREFKAFTKGVNEMGDIDFEKVVDAAYPSGTGPLQAHSVGKDAATIMREAAKIKASPEGRLAAGGLGLIGIARGVSLPAIAASAAGGTALATKTVQRGLYGDLAKQKAISEWIRKNPVLAKQFGSIVRKSVIQENQE